ncbi:MAG: ASCH domain-containing protein [Treponemataceae bacterium]|nr:ASCH domain-containing protein [Treponemataceae bacterium]
MTTEEYWKDFLSRKGLDPQMPHSGEVSFGTDEVSCAQFLALIVSGKKTAAFGALESYRLDNESLPKKGAFTILTDYTGNPIGVIQTLNVTILPYNAITWDMAVKEGECADFEEWHAAYDEFFADDADIMGYDVTPDMPVVFEEFVLVDKIGC